MKKLLVVMVLLASSRAGAPPPISSFPSVILPADGSEPPRNTLLWAFGRDAPPLDSVGLSLSVNGMLVDTSATAFGCCLVRAAPEVPFAGEESAVLTVSTAGAELTSTFTLAPHDDTQPPTLTDATVLDYSQGRLILGVAGTDEHEVAGFWARAVGTDQIVGAAPPGYVLEATASQDGCVDVAAIDLAGHQSALRTVCAGSDGEGEGEGEGEGDGEVCACTSAEDASPLAALAVLAAMGARLRRRAGPPRETR